MVSPCWRPRCSRTAPGTARPRAAQDGQRRTDGGANWSEPGRQRSGVAPVDGHPNRRRLLPNGQKIWSSRAPFGDRAFGLFRSRSGCRRHRGLTYFMFDLDGDGVTVRPIRQLGGDTGFGEIFLDEEFRSRSRCDRQPARRLASGDEHVEQRARNVAAEPARFLAPAERLVRAWNEGGGQSGVRRTGGRCVDQGAGLPAAHVRHRHQAKAAGGQLGPNPR